MTRAGTRFLVCLATLGPALSAAGDEPAAGAPGATSPEDWAKLARPGAPHEKLAFFVGDWRVTSTRQLESETVVSEGTERCELLLGGRYLRSVTTSTVRGAPFEGLGISGFDNATGEHFNVWFDNMGTGVMVSRGKEDAEGRTVLIGTFADPARGEVPYRMVTTVTGEDSYTFEMFMATDASATEQRIMEARYTRVRS